MSGNGDLVFSDSAADSMTSALSKAGSAVADLRPADAGGFELGDATVAAAASDLFIGLHAFGQGLVVGVAHCTKSVTDARDSLAAIDKQLEAAAPVAPAAGISTPVKHDVPQPGAAPSGVNVAGLNISHPDFSAVGQTSTHTKTYVGSTTYSHENTRSLLTDERTETTIQESDGTKSVTKVVTGPGHESGGKQ
jgi:hypothetical protein